ncbi:MAG: dephospho-CoA kinase [Blastomonas sp.]
MIKRARRRHRPMVLGLTGSIGMGKSAVASMLRRLGVPLFDADAAVHRLQGPGGALLPQIEAAFPGTTGPNGVDRQELGARVFGNGEALKRLERIIHPAVGRERSRFFRRNRAHPMIVFDVPLLFETGGSANVDAILVVSARPWQQRKRVMARANMTRAKFRHIRKLQTPDHIKRRHADFIVDTGQTMAETRASVRSLVQYLRSTLA